MKTIYSSPNSLLLLFLYLVGGIESYAQGTWIEQVVQPSMSGTTLTKTGSDCIIHTMSSSRYVYFFDINCKTWSECDLGSQQNMKAVEAGKHVVFAYSDSLLIGYSSVTSTYQVIAYYGNILSPGSASSGRGYGCGDDAAYVWTDQNYFYVFDGLAGQWMLFYSGPMANGTGTGNFWCGDTYVAGVFPRFYPDKYRNVAYSLITKTFNITETGGTYVATGYSEPMTGGFVSSWGGQPDSVIFTGYSSYTNEFNKIEEAPSYGFFNISFLENENWSNFKERNVFGYCITRGTGYGEPRDAKINVFDTQRARWLAHSFTYSPFQFGDVWVATAGGNICTFAQEDAVSNELTFFAYSGETGSYQIIKPGVYNPGYLISGNNYSGFLDNRKNSWFYNGKTDISQTIAGDSNYVNMAPSSDYISFCRYNASSSLMDIWFYNSLTDRLSKIQSSKDVYPDFRFSPQAYIFALTPPENRAVFYSPIHDSILPVNTVLSDGNSSFGSIGVFAFLHNLNASLVFDAANMKVINRNAALAMSGISDSLVLFKSGNIFDVYDASNGKITTFDLGGPAGYQTNGGNVILLSNSNFSWFYAFQKGSDEWVELIPEGNSLWYSSAENTAVVARTTKVYAFAPGVLTSIEDDRKNRPERITLDQNYPNPFFPSTSISFSFPSKSFVSLKIVDALGTEVSTLVSEELKAGDYTFKWDASGLPTGIYFYQLQAGSISVTKKLVVIK
jgi:hypothetical protein